MDELLARIRSSVIGDDTVIDGPFGPRRIAYADYTASGRALTFIEDHIRDHVLPWYANTHSESAATGRRMTRLREEARNVIRDAVGGGDDTAVIFSGSGATGAVNKLVAILGLVRRPGAAKPKAGPVVFTGPYEHHSNELPWRESTAEVVTIPEAADGRLDLAALERALLRHRDRELLIGSFSAGSNVTGILSDIDSVSSLLHSHGALALWDFAAAAPYIDIRFDGPDGTHKDALFLSPHKFVGGAQTPGVLVVRKALLRNAVPSVPGGGTVDYVSPSAHHYVADPIHREEGGTPAIVESIRAGLVFGLKQAVGVATIHRRERDFLSRALATWRAEPNFELLGNPDAQRLAIVAFLARAPGGRYLHHNFVVAVLNDLFGIQSRGGCSCAGPYGHRLLKIDDALSQRYFDQIRQGHEGLKPGWTRVGFNYFLSEAMFSYLVEAVTLVVRHGWKLLPRYRFDLDTGYWRHRDEPDTPPAGTAEPWFDAGIPEPGSAPRRTATEAELPGYLDYARRLFERLDAPDIDTAPPIPGLFEPLRWFALPQDCRVRGPVSEPGTSPRH